MRIFILLVLLTLSVGSQAIDPTQCLLKITIFVNTLKQELVNVTSFKELIPVVFTKQNIQLLNDTLTTCGYPLPLVKINGTIAKQLRNQSFIVRVQAYKFYKSLRCNNSSLSDKVLRFLSLAKSSLKLVYEGEKLANSLTVNGQTVWNIDTNTTCKHCSRIMIFFAERTVLALKNATSFVDIIKYFSCNQTRAILRRINTVCKLGIPTVSFNKTLVMNCKQQVWTFKKEVLPLIQQVQKDGFNQMVLIQAMGLFARLQQVKETCSSAFQSIEIKNDVSTQPIKLEQHPNGNQWCFDNCKADTVKCLKNCRNLPFCKSSCDKDLARCNMSCDPLFN